MPNGSFRMALRARTSLLHQQLDAETGEFDNLQSYGGFVQRSHSFRSALESALVGGEEDGWTSDPITGLIELDLLDLALDKPTAPSFRPDWSSRWSRMGAHYVLEGSGIGARLLLQRAKRLGMSEHHGARHLAQQARSIDRWSAFLAAIETVPPGRREEALAAAEATFTFALSVYSRAQQDLV